MFLSKTRLRVGFGAALAIVMASSPMSWAATDLFLSHSSGISGQYTSVAGAGFTGGATSGASNDVINFYADSNPATSSFFTIGGASPTADASNTGDTQPLVDSASMVAFQLPTDLYPAAKTAGAAIDQNDSVFVGDTNGSTTNAQKARTVFISVGSGNRLPFDVVSLDVYGISPVQDTKPHGDFSTSTDFCLSCHMIHKGNPTHTNQSVYALLGTENDGSALTAAGINTANFGSLQNGLSSPYNDNGGGIQSPINIVTQVCNDCHNVGGVSQGLGTPGTQITSPAGGFASAESVATTAHYNVYKNTANVSHPMGAFEPPDSVNVQLSYLNLNTTAYQSSQYGSAAPQQSNSNISNTTDSLSGLYCGSCHSPHGNFSANAWMGWDAAQFSENYGNHYDANAKKVTLDANNVNVFQLAAAQVADTDNTSSDHNYWAEALDHGYAGTQPLTNALLIDNPGHQNGINNNANSTIGGGNGTGNPNVPSSTDVENAFTASQNGNMDASSMNFSPFVDPVEVGVGASQTAVAAISAYVGSVVDPMFGNKSVTFVTNSASANGYGYGPSITLTSDSTKDLGTTDDTLSNFCMACHNLNGGAYSEMQGHPAHPMQGVLSPDSAGINSTYNINDASNGGYYDNIVNGCTECHGSPMAVSNSANFVNGFDISVPTGAQLNATASDNGGTNFSEFDFPHTTPAPSYTNPSGNPQDDILLKAGPDALCLSCHDSAPGWSSLP